MRKSPKLHAREDSRLQRRGPRRRSRLGLLTALDAARRPSPPHPQRGPRRRASTTWRLQPTSVPPRLGVFNRRPPAWFCGANQETRLPSPLAPSIQEWMPQLPPSPSSGPGCLHHRPPHGPSATTPPRQLTVDTRRPCTCNQRPNTRSHRTVDNSLITARRRYSTFLKRFSGTEPCKLTFLRAIAKIKLDQFVQIKPSIGNAYRKR